LNTDKKKILIIRLSSIGDILLTTPFIRQVRNKFQNGQIDYIIRGEFKELLLGNHHIDNLIEYNVTTGKNGIKELAFKLDKNNYDYIFDLHNNFRSIYLRKHIKSEYKNKIVKDKFIQSLLVFLKINKYKKITPIPERYLNIGKPVGIEDDGLGLELFWNEEINRSLTENPLTKELVKTKFLAVAPGAGFFTKKWPLENYQELINNILKANKIEKIVLLGSDTEKEETEQLCRNTNIINLAGEMSLLQSAAILAKSKVLISNDSGLMHMATAVKTPVLSIFGSTVREFGFFPYRAKSIVVENKNLDCRPCSHIGRKSCPKKHFKCMKDITPEKVFNEFENLING